MMHRWMLALVASVALAAPALGQDGRLEITTERVVVFKDGYCLVVKKAVGMSNDAGEVFTEEVPDAAVLGSFWATSPDGPVLSTTAGVVKSEAETSTREACSQYLELLGVNEGKQASIELDTGTTIAGVLRKVLTREQPQPLPPPSPWARLGGHVRPLAVQREGTVLTGSLFTIATDAGDVVLGVHRIRRLTIRDMELEIERKVQEKRTTKRLTFRFEGGAAKRTLHLMYFRPGVRWVPTYRVSLANGKAAEQRASIRLQAEILNEAEDLVDVPFDVVVGVPNFRFKSVVSPFVLEQALRNALQQAAPALMSQSLSNGAFFVNQTGEIGVPPSGTVAVPAEIVAGRTQDLFVYSLPRMTLRKGERAAVPVFEGTAPYRDVHTWEVALTRQDIEAAPSGASGSPLTISTNQVWHQIELTNESGVPWTTGAVLIMDGHQPVAQELLTYTSAGAKVRVPLTVAVDVHGTYAEEETGRQLEALKWLRQSYARIDKKGSLSITNRKGRAIDLEIRCRLGGHADAATDDGRITIGAFESGDWSNYLGHPAANNHSVVTFSLRLDPGGTLTPEIKYHYFTRH